METDEATHRRLAIDANNSTWEILGKPAEEISMDDADEMTKRAYAAAYHWARAAERTVANEARAEWLISRVWAVRGVGELALVHAERCMNACVRGALIDFDLAYAHEALARAHACLGDATLASTHRDEATSVEIADPEDRSIVEADLAAEPWFGI